MVPDFKSIEDIKMPELARKSYEMMGGSKTLLDVTYGVVDKGNQTRLDLGMDRSGANVDTQLMIISRNDPMRDCMGPPSPWPLE
jgi:hypothetical protein